MPATAIPTPLLADGPVLLTGATGFVGMELLARYLERTDRTVYALVRAPDEAAAQARLLAAAAQVVPSAHRYADRLVAVRGDIAAPGLGLAVRQRDALAREIVEIVHAAASVAFTLPLPQAREINVGGTRRLLELARRAQRHGGLRRFAHVSTAYVAGAHRGRFREDDLDVGQRHRNAYERTKWEAELLVRAQMDRLPIQVFRPSIVVGERDSGWTPAFNVIYAPLRAFARGATLPLMPARRTAPVDVVPVDYVADAIFELTRRPTGAGETYALAAGERASTVGELLDLAAGTFERRRPIALAPALYRRTVHRALLRRSAGDRRRWLERSEAFHPYLAVRTRYDTRRARAALAPAGLDVPPLTGYFDRLVDYALATDWGRAPMSRVEAADGRRRRRPRPLRTGRAASAQRIARVRRELEHARTRA